MNAGPPSTIRRATVERVTRETRIALSLTVPGDAPAPAKVKTGVPFFSHMLEALAKHSAMALELDAEGDLEVDAHHTVEDTALALGQALREALGDKTGITRYGDAAVPLDEACAWAVVDLSGRPYLVHEEPAMVALIGSYDTTLTRHIFESLVASAQICLHIRVLGGRNGHHIVEAQFKALARALRQAIALDPRVTGVPSTKGAL